MENEDGIFDSAHKVNISVKSITSNFPKDVIYMIMGYDSDRSLREVMAKVTSRLGKLGKKLNFYSKFFLKRFVKALESKSDKFPNFYLFWWDAERLLFKHILYLKQEKLLNAPDNELEKASKTIQSIIHIIEEKSPELFPSNFSLKAINFDGFSSDLLNSELFERIDYLSHRSADALETFYSFILKTDKGKERISCKNFKDQFFDDGNPNIDVLLKSLMIKNVWEKGIKECIENGTQSEHSNIDNRVIDRIKNKIIELRNLEDFKKSIELIKMKHATNSIMHFIYSKNIKVPIENGFDFYTLLQRMKESGLLQREKLEKIAEFGEITRLQRWLPNSEWSLEHFEFCLKNYEKYFPLTDNDCILRDEFQEFLFWGEYAH